MIMYYDAPAVYPYYGVFANRIIEETKPDKNEVKELKPESKRLSEMYFPEIRNYIVSVINRFILRELRGTDGAMEFLQLLTFVLMTLQV